MHGSGALASPAACSAVPVHPGPGRDLRARNVPASVPVPAVRHGADSDEPKPEARPHGLGGGAHRGGLPLAPGPPATTEDTGTAAPHTISLSPGPREL